MMRVNDKVKAEMERLKDLMNFKTHSELVAFLLVTYEEKLHDTLPVVQHMTFRKMAKELNTDGARQMDIYGAIRKAAATDRGAAK